MISRRDIGSVEQKIDGRTLSGVAAVYGAQSREISEHGRTFTERIAPGAFGESVRGDIKLFYNHDARMPLARSRSGTLALEDRADGLHYTATLPETTLGMIDASTTRRPARPCTRRRASTTSSAPGPMRQLPTGW